MAWWRRTRKAETETAAAPSPAFQRQETDAERILRWRRAFAEKDKRVAAERAREATIGAEAQARRDEAYRDWVAANIARSGAYFPGDAPEEVRQGVEQISGDDPAQSGGENGLWYGFLRFPR